MSIEQVESAILALRPEERRRLVLWLDEHRHDLFGADEEKDLLPEQKAEILARRQEYIDNPERFVRMDERSLEEMFARIRHHVAARVSSAD
jgi:hypothetical protein